MTIVLFFERQPFLEKKVFRYVEKNIKYWKIIKELSVSKLIEKL